MLPSGAWLGPFADPVEIVTAPIPAQSPFIPADAKIVVGAVAPASPDPIPLVLLPGFEYRMREWRHPETHEMHWRLEQPKSHPASRRRGVTHPAQLLARAATPILLPAKRQQCLEGSLPARTLARSGRGSGRATRGSGVTPARPWTATGPWAQAQVPAASPLLPASRSATRPAARSVSWSVQPPVDLPHGADRVRVSASAISRTIIATVSSAAGSTSRVSCRT